MDTSYALVYLPYIAEVLVYKAEVKISRRNETEEYLIPRAYTTLNQHGVP